MEEITDAEKKNLSNSSVQSIADILLSYKKGACREGVQDDGPEQLSVQSRS